MIERGSAVPSAIPSRSESDPAAILRTTTPIGMISTSRTSCSRMLRRRMKWVGLDEIADGLGPVYNAQSCAECHQNPVTGAISQISELRAGHNDGSGNFVPATLTINDGGGLPGGITIANRSLINQRATCPGVVTDNDPTNNI